MTTEDLTILIQNTQCRHASWAANFEKSLSLGLCTSKMYYDNIMISNYIEVMYRYEPYIITVTNFDSVILPAGDGSIGTFSIVITYRGVDICNISFTGTLEQLYEAIVENINNDTITHGYYALIVDNILYLYTYNDDAEFSDLPSFTINGHPKRDPAVNAEDIIEQILGPSNCLTEDDICAIYNRIISLTEFCSCN